MANKAIIGITDWDVTRRELRELAHRLDAGEEMPEADFHLNFATAEQLLGELSPKRLDLLRTIKAEGPMSIYALAKRLGRNYSNVHQEVAKSLLHGLVEKDAHGRVFMPWEDVIVRIDASVVSQDAAA